MHGRRPPELSYGGGMRTYLALLAACSLAPAQGATDRDSVREKGTRFVVFGHSYPIVDKGTRLEEFLAAINDTRPDYVFILGDSEAGRPEVMKRYQDALKARIICAPGNHDLGSGPYESTVGYFETVVRAPDWNFLVINSSEGDYRQLYLV